MRDYDTIIIGTGCAGFNAADWLYDLGHKKIAIVTEGVCMGTSRNTGSDKQTYYKLSLASDGEDSVSQMAHTLFSGGGMNGDTALVEAACSVKSFMKLANMGVPFPTNIYGEYVGYKTDHDPRQRATSCGPLTSKLMTEALERSVRSKGIEIIDNMQAVELITAGNRIAGLIAVSKTDYTLKSFSCYNVILATGGSAGIYYNTVYPESQTGATGLALSTGAKAANLSEWQYGLASVKFRWNVSGTYQQVLPKYISVSADGTEREFLPDYFASSHDALDMVFLKGYQWPFDVRKTEGSSRIDMIIHKEINEKGNRVFMDFRSNPSGLECGRFDKLSEEARNYLKNSGADFGTPIERLEKMNVKAIELYKAHGIDLYSEPLEVAVCAQHCNGGIDVDINWESSVKGLYVVGEAAGTFGVYRPGGSALNSAQVGSMRAAEHIAYKKAEQSAAAAVHSSIMAKRGISTVVEKRLYMQKQMSKYAAYIRDIGEMERLYAELLRIRDNFAEEHTIADDSELPYLYKNYDILITQIAVLSAMIKSAKEIGSRGSGLVDGSDGRNASAFDGKVLITLNNESYFEPVRPMPECNDWFENVWNEYNRRVGL